MLINMNKRPTIQTVAERAGVSRGTVDRVLNNRSYVRADVRERVLDAIRETGYLSPREAHRQTADRPQNYSPVKLGVLLPNWAGPFREEVTRGIESARVKLSGRHAEIRVCTCETDIPGEAITLLDKLVDWGAQGIALCALNDITIEAKVGELADNGIPCITFNSDLPNSRRLCFVGQDIYKAGQVAGGLMSRCIPAGSQLLATVGNLKFDGHRQRLAGFRDRIREAGFPMEDLVVAETFNDYETTFRVVTEAIDRYPRLRGIYMANLSVSGCAAAIEQAGKKGAIRLICHDLNESVRQLLLRGSIDFTIPQNLRQQGYGPLILLRDVLRRKAAPDAARFNRQIDIVCSDNLP